MTDYAFLSCGIAICGFGGRSGGSDGLIVGSLGRRVFECSEREGAENKMSRCREWRVGR